eukprot:TRINITY_DN10129_c0_g1_i1.p1 TRINITY_DN10129_c0_g1~~TRINITY_DN10129_c0_g1_i1.p1  ORF type:complete len:214 (-),score=34.89 TRINITY_DN10129_c0_g1_i1:308-949(-)
MGCAMSDTPRPDSDLECEFEAACDKCDRRDHSTRNCPIFSKKREKHPDALRRRCSKEIGGDGGDAPGKVLDDATIVPQPGDGSCLFHSLAAADGRTHTGEALRKAVSEYIMSNPDLEIAGDPMRDWVLWDSGVSLEVYCRKMSVSGWGGGIEMAAFSRMRKVNVHVYERSSGIRDNYHRVSAFEVSGARSTVRVLYQGRAHFDLLVWHGCTNE